MNFKLNNLNQFLAYLFTQTNRKIRNKMYLEKIRSIAFHPKAWNLVFDKGRSSDLFLLQHLPGFY